MTWLSDAHDWGCKFEKKWSELKSQKSFREVAVQGLGTRSWSEGFELKDVVRECFRAKALGQQLNPDSSFGNPPITLFYSSDHNFVLDLYIWNDSQTAIHGHSFEGAFQVLQGKSVEMTYEFHSDSEGTPWGKIIPRNIHFLNVGEVREIDLHEKLIHRVVHLSSPTVSLVLRTINNEPKKPLSNYSFGTLESPTILPPEDIIRIRLVDWMVRNGVTPDRVEVLSLTSYFQFWETIFSSDEGRRYAMKLSIMNDHPSVISGFEKNHLLINLLNQMKSEDPKIMLLALEFFGDERGIEWAAKISGTDQIKALTDFRTAVTSSPLFQSDIFSRNVWLTKWMKD